LERTGGPLGKKRKKRDWEIGYRGREVKPSLSIWGTGATKGIKGRGTREEIYPLMVGKGGKK